MDQLLSTSASDTTSKSKSGDPETKSSDKNEKSEGSESSDGGSDQKNDRASGKDVRGAVKNFDKCYHEQVYLIESYNSFGLMFD